MQVRSGVLYVHYTLNIEDEELYITNLQLTCNDAAFVKVTNHHMFFILEKSIIKAGYFAIFALQLVILTAYVRNNGYINPLYKYN